MEHRASGFWIIGGSKSIGRFVHKCVQCCKQRRLTEEQKMADLPEEHCEIAAPFTFCGKDCFGPFAVKNGHKEIITCLSSRAVHIEMLDELSTDSFMDALRCFISLRGAVSYLCCNQGKNFGGASNELKEALSNVTATLKAFLANRQLEFMFNAPSASHAGGVWERQIRSIHSALNVTIAQCPGRLNDASLRTLFYEAMSIVNSHPLCVDGINEPRSLESITPNHLILMKAKVALPSPRSFVKADLYIAKRW